MSPDTYLQMKPYGQKLKLVRAENITVGEEKHHFKTTRDWLYFSLFFPPIELKTSNVDVIEGSDFNDFNFYDIILKTSEGIKVMKNSLLV